MSSTSKIVIDVRPIVSRVKLVCLGHDMDVRSETYAILEGYGFDKLIQDLLLYGNEFLDIPGNAHYTKVIEKIEHLYTTELDGEIMSFILAELEYTLYAIYKLDVCLIHPLYAEWPLIIGGLVIDST